MPLLEGFWIKNFRVLKQFAIGSCYLQFVYIDEDVSQMKYELSPVSILIGNNGTGKSTVLDAFTFINDCINYGVEDACQVRGGYESICSQGSTGPISFGFNFRLTPHSKILTYVVNIGFGQGNRPYIETELLAYRAESAESLQMPILFFQNGEKIVRHLLSNGKINNELTQVERTDLRHLGIKLLSELRDYPVVRDVKKFFADFYLSASSRDNLRAFTPSPTDLDLPVLNSRGEGLLTLIQHLQKEYPTNFQAILNRAAVKIPEVEKIDISKGKQNRLSLSVKKKKYQNPFQGHQLSEGFLKLLTYSLLLEEPAPPPFIGIDELENGLDPSNLELFVKDLRAATRVSGCSQFLITTHFQSWADWIDPADVWILELEKDGFTGVQRRSDFPVLRDLMQNNLRANKIYL